MSSENYILIMNLLIPITMIVLGSYYKKNAPKNINSFYGYRTSMSMKNNKTWEFSHHYIGGIWLKLGWILLVISAIPMLFVIGKDKSTINNFSLILCVIQIIFLISPILPTEKALRKNFDKDGNMRI